MTDPYDIPIGDVIALDAGLLLKVEPPFVVHVKRESEHAWVAIVPVHGEQVHTARITHSDPEAAEPWIVHPFDVAHYDDEECADWREALYCAVKAEPVG